MKLASTICTPDTNAKYLAYRDDLEQMFNSLRDIGYQGVEPFVRDPRTMDQSEFSRALEHSGLEVVAVGTGPLVSEDKLTFTSLDERVRIEAIERTKAVIDFAARFGAQVNVGKLRGDIYKGNPLQAKEWMKEAFITICDYAASKNTFITLEPQCRFSIDNLRSTQEGLAWIKELKIPNLFIMLDTFHINIEDKSFAASLIEAKEYTRHIHFADNNRGVPGVGNINFLDIVRVLKALGYQRYISMEIEQAPDCYTAAKASYEYVTRLISEA
jgi:sugar phosphate isomerase/epimerase